MANFDEILSNLHQTATLVDTQIAQPIVITSRRVFEIPPDYDLVLGYAGDVNSQLVTFQIPKIHEGHDLAKCHFKKIKWANLTSGTEGVSNLTVKTENTDSWLATWAVPPEMMTVAGNVEIAISIYDEQNDTIAFSWNTPSYRGFSIGAFLKGETSEEEAVPAEIKVGSIVKIKNGAYMYNTNRKLASWVYPIEWVVLQIRGDKVIVDKSADGKHSIETPVDIDDLTLVK